ncbi:hypothetical protein NKR23_g10891 [Pleurostoma richardsiae]|uniref:Uncharacterized protein n=1 Tax=Pleurostoma richardsiae TaxID=41990 RepID=A0AA38RC20_9PEZI|nr:hypothetical protein NKR23_g10891 [Pleurostoma richardsiae]
MLKSRLRLGKDPGRSKYANLPENILVCHDGVSEDQYQTGLDAEVPLLRQAREDMYSHVGAAFALRELYSDVG